MALCADLVREPSVQCAILNGSRLRGGWDEQSDLDILIILEDGADEEETRRAARAALHILKERHYPGYMDYHHPDHEISHGEIIVSMDYFLTHRCTLNHVMAQAACQGRIFPKEPGTHEKYRHDGDTSNEWELVTLGKLERAVRENETVPIRRRIFDGPRRSRLDVRTTQGSTAYWILWSLGSALMSILGIMYENRSLVTMGDTLREKDPEWGYQFASDLDCLD